MLGSHKVKEENGRSHTNDRDDSPGNSSRDSSGDIRGLRRSKIIRNKTALLPEMRIKLKNRFARLQSAEITQNQNKNIAKKESINDKALESSSNNQASDDSINETKRGRGRPKKSNPVKMTGRRPGRPRLTSKFKNVKSVRIKKRFQKKVNKIKTKKKTTQAKQVLKRKYVK